MPREYTLVFTARRIGALGVRDRYQRTVIADDRDDAIAKLYDEFEHVSHVRIEEPNE